MLAALVVLLLTLGLLCSGHRAIALENVALRQQLSIFRRTVRRPHLRTSDRVFWVLLAQSDSQRQEASNCHAHREHNHHEQGDLRGFWLNHVALPAREITSLR